MSSFTDTLDMTSLTQRLDEFLHRHALKLCWNLLTDTLQLCRLYATPLDVTISAHPADAS